MNKRLRAEPSNNRFLLLMALKNIEVHPGYPLNNLHSGSLTVTGKRNSIEVCLQVEAHPYPGRYKANCYDYELMLLSWNKSNEPPAVEIQSSPWIPIKRAMPAVSFSFEKRKDARHWALFLRQRLAVKSPGREEQYVEAKVGEGMQLLEVGSFVAADIKLLEEKKKAGVDSKKPEARQPDKRERKGIINYGTA